MVKIGIVSNVNMDLLPGYLKSHLTEWSDDVEFYVAGFNQVSQEVLMPTSGLKTFQPDVVILFVDIEEYLWDILTDSRDINKATSMLDDLLGLIRQYAESFKYVLVNDGVVRDIFDGLNDWLAYDLVDYYNRGLREIDERYDNMHVARYGALIRRYGWNNLYSDKMMYLGSIRFSKLGFKKIAEMYASYIRAIWGKTKKVLVLDADNVLWGGIIGEDGIEGIKLDAQKEGRIYRDFQRIVRLLSSKGIPLAINSKNNEYDVREVLQKHPYMVLKEDDFAVMKINWRDKASNLQEIAEEMNLGVDSFVFVDDSPFERSLVREKLPQVVVPEFPQDVATLPVWISDIEKRYFPKVYVTDDDRKRKDMYKAQVQRSQFMKSASNIEDYLRGLEMKMYVNVDDISAVKRIAQLTQRTNQFNMTTKRYTEQDIKEFMESDNYHVFHMRLVDRFGDNGIVGVVIVKKEDKEAEIDTFLMSCRVIGREAERAFMWFVEKYLADEGVEFVYAKYIPTKKNKLIMSKYEDLNYSLVKEADGIKEYTKKLPDNMIEKPEWIEVIHNG